MPPRTGYTLGHAGRQLRLGPIAFWVVVGTLVITINVLADILGAATNPLKHKEWYALR